MEHAGASPEHTEQRLLEHMEQRLPGSRYVQLLQWSTRSSCLPAAQRAALREHVEQRLSRSKYSCSTGAHIYIKPLFPRTPEHREQLQLSSDYLGAQREALLEYIEQHLSGNRCVLVCR